MTTPEAFVCEFPFALPFASRQASVSSQPASYCSNRTRFPFQTHARTSKNTRRISAILQSSILIVPPENLVSFSFTAASLRPELIRVIANAFLETGSWELAKKKIRSSNALQSRSPRTAVRMEIELRQRLMRLTPGEIQLAAHGIAEERTAIAWLAALKASRYIHAFASEVLRGKLSSLDPVVRASDYETFFENQSAVYPSIATLATSSRAKIRSILLTMICEAGIGQRAGREVRIHRPVVPPSVYSALLADSPHWLAGFLVPDSEIPSN